MSQQTATAGCLSCAGDLRGFAFSLRPYAPGRMACCSLAVAKTNLCIRVWAPHTHTLFVVCFVFVCMYVCMYVCMCVCACVCVSACVRPWSHLKSLCFPHNFPKHFVLCHATGDPPGCAVVMRGWALAKVLLSSGNSTKLLNIR